MSDVQRVGGTGETPARQNDPEKDVHAGPDSVDMFAGKQPEKGGMPLAWAAAGVLVLVIVAGWIFAGRRNAAATPNTVQPNAAYAANLPLSQLAMSESTSLSGGKSTFVDGRIQNTGSQTVTGVTVQVLFRNNEGMPPQVETVPLSLIRTREPY